MTDKDILRASWLENFKWAKELNELYGADHPKSKKQWEVCNQLTLLLNNKEE